MRVDVRVVVDMRGSAPEEKSRDMYERLAASGVSVCVVRATKVRSAVGPLGSGDTVRWNLHGLGHFDHRKMTVVDGSVGWVGGAGIEDHFGERITEVNQEFSATPIGAPMARQLRVEPKTAGFVITRRYYGEGGVLLLATITTFPHDRMKYSMTLNVA